VTVGNMLKKKKSTSVTAANTVTGTDLDERKLKSFRLRGARCSIKTNLIAFVA
jgi:hypothetical protein